MGFQDTPLPGGRILTPPAFGDDHGIFWESWNARTLKGLGIETDFGITRPDWLGWIDVARLEGAESRFGKNDYGRHLMLLLCADGLD